METNQPVKTYLMLGNKDESTNSENIMELDLITARHKGEEIRYLSINFQKLIGSQVSENSISLDEEGFNNLKEFFAQLSWNS